MAKLKNFYLKMFTVLMMVLAVCISAAAADHPEIRLWPNGAPGSEGKTAPETIRIGPEGEHIISNVNFPSITPYLPEKDKATGAAVIVIPGGGHRELWMDHEGYRVGQWLSDHGIAAFVLKYRLAKAEGSTYTIEGNSLPDVQRAIRLVRSRAAEWDINAAHVGVIGFSAGGELAALADTQYDDGKPGAEDPIDRLSSKPAFAGLLYPEIPSDRKLSKDTPPVFLLCGGEDTLAPSQGLAELFLSYKRAGASAELHILAGVGHGFGIRASNPPAVAIWIDLFYNWLGARGFLNTK
jgi:acetyl esterase/lipase